MELLQLKKNTVKDPAPNNTFDKKAQTDCIDRKKKKKKYKDRKLICKLCQKVSAEGWLLSYPFPAFLFTYSFNKYVLWPNNFKVTLEYDSLPQFHVQLEDRVTFFIYLFFKYL